MRALVALACAGAGAVAYRTPRGAPPEEHVDTRFGTAGTREKSYGNLVPLVTAPWGFNGWSVETSDDTTGGWWWSTEGTRLYGIRCTHRASPWIGDYGYFGILPLTDHTDGWDGVEYPSVKFAPAAASAEWRPYLFAADTDAGRVEVTSSDHAAFIRGEFAPAATGARPVLRIQVTRGSDAVAYHSNDGTIAGFTTTGHAASANNHTLYFTGSVSPAAAVQEARVVATRQGDALVLVFAAGTATVDLRVATSFISAAQAAANLREVGGTFAAVQVAAKARWNTLLSRYQVHDPAAMEGQLKVVYTAMYRAMTFPRFLTERDGATGEDVHYSTYQGTSRGGVFPGPAVTDSGFWDAYRTVYSFLQLAAPDALGRITEGWVNAYREGGWLPKWAAPGYRDGMVGTMGDVVLADAIVNDVPGFDVEAAYAAIARDADEPAPQGASNVGRKSLSTYLEFGYVPAGGHDDVSLALNYMMADWAVGNAARKLGKPGADAYFARGANYTKLFKDGFFRPRDRDGSFLSHFDEFAWGGSYTEGGPWQYRFYVPWDPLGLKALYQRDGLDVCEELLRAQTIEPRTHSGGYGGVIHEMREMKDNCWGQYAHNNQPAHHMLYMFIATSQAVNDTCAQHGQRYLRRAMQTLYKPAPEMYPGDEDNGEMSAWFLLSAMGLYNLQPSSGQMFLGIPLFANMSLVLPRNRTLFISTTGGDASAEARVEAVTFNSERVQGVTLPYASLMQGGDLVFALAAPATPTPPPTTATAAPRPPVLRGGLAHADPGCIPSAMTTVVVAAVAMVAGGMLYRVGVVRRRAR